MTINTLRAYIVNHTNDTYFEYDGKECGIEQEVHDDVVTYYICSTEKP